jgi:hypothetical protein
MVPMRDDHRLRCSTTPFPAAETCAPLGWDTLNFLNLFGARAA